MDRLLLFLALVSVCLPAVQPLLRGEISCGYDNAFHLYRAVQINHLWDQGVLFSRWAPDMAHGFGFPLFVFGPPLAQGLLALVHRLGVAWPVGMNLVFLMGVAFGGFFMFHLAKMLYGVHGGGSRVAGLAGGAVATVAYVYAPFLAYDVYNRGSLWESFAWAFPPLVLLGMHRWSLDRDRRYLIAGVAALAAMIMTHYPFAFLFAPVFVLWALVQGYLRRSWAVVGRAALLGALGMGVTTFFWVPALFERSFIQTGRLLGTWVFDYHHNFLPFSHLLALPRRADPALVNDWPEKSLGLVPLLVAVLPALGWRSLGRQRRRQMRWQLGTLWVLAVGLSALTLPLSLWVWEHVPLLSFVQFPWRYLGPAAFCLALLAGAVPGALPAPRALAGSQRDPRSLGWVTTALICVLVVANLGWFYPSSCSVPGNLTVEGIIRWERLTDTLGTTAKGEYLPIWVERFPDVTLDDQYAAGGEIVRLRSEELPAGATISRATSGALQAEIALETPEAFTARYLAFYYPGWRVTVDDVPVPVAPEEETGLVTFDVPAGAHVIKVVFGETPLRWASDSVAVLSVLVLVVLVGSGEGPTLSSPEVTGDTSTEGSGSRAVAWDLLGAAVVLIAIKGSVVDGQGLLWRSSRWDGADVVAGAAVPLTANFGDQAMFLGVETLPQEVSSEDTPVLTLYWRALAPGGEDWQVGLTLVGPDGSRWPVGIRPARWARIPGPVSEWPKDGYARMDTLLDLELGMVPGTYRLELALFDRATAEPASVLDAVGNPIGPALVLGDVSIVPPNVPPSLQSLGVGAGAEMQPCKSVGLWTAGLNRGKAAPGDSVVLTTVWEALAATEDNLAAEAVLLSETGDVVASWAFAPAASWWPTSLWTSGQRWLGKHELRVPGSLASGAYALHLSSGDCDLGRLELEVEAPERTWELPVGFTAVDEVLGDQIRLSGYQGLPDATAAASGSVAPGETLDLVLGWEALREITTAYRIFVHMVDDQGHILAQNDGEPTGWTRPTTGWAVGEVVIDPRSLQIPETAEPEPIEIRVGVYAPEGQRLLLADGADSILLGRFEVGE